jgi:hypothetical protein
MYVYRFLFGLTYLYTFTTRTVVRVHDQCWLTRSYFVRILPGYTVFTAVAGTKSISGGYY